MFLGRYNTFLLALLLVIVTCEAQTTFTKAKYSINGGPKKVTIFNRNKANREKQYLAADSLFNSAKLILAQQQIALKSIDSSHRSEGLEKARDASEVKIDALYEELRKIDPYTQKGHKRSLEILTAINDLIYNNIIPIGTLIIKNKEIKELRGDFSFTTGSAKLTQSGISEISNQLKQLEQNILDWQNYLNNHNERIFVNDKYKLMVVIEGYADRQGSESVNLKLSEARAEAVRNEFMSQLKILSSKYKLLYDVTYEGKGEALPSGVIDNGLERDEKRRICRIISVVGPSKFVDRESK